MMARLSNCFIGIYWAHYVIITVVPIFFLATDDRRGKQIQMES
jgi:hypothetical protein